MIMGGRLSAQESLQLIARGVVPRPWGQPLIGIAHPNAVLGFIRDELRGVRITASAVARDLLVGEAVRACMPGAVTS